MRSEEGGLDERIDEGVLRWFDHVEKERIAKRLYVGECVGRPWKRWIDTVKMFEKKRCQASKENGAGRVNGGGL